MRTKETRQIQSPPLRDPKIERCYQARQEMANFSQAISQLREQTKKLPSATQDKK